MNIGLSFTEIIGILTVLGALIAAWVTVQIRIAKMETHILSIRTEFEKHKADNREDFRQAYTDNKDEFRLIHEKLDKLLK